MRVTSFVALLAGTMTLTVTMSATANNSPLDIEVHRKAPLIWAP